MNKTYKLWTTGVTIIDNFLSDQDIVDQLKAESMIEKTIAGQDTDNFTLAQNFLYTAVSAMIVNYCLENDIDYNNLKLNDLQKGCLYRYDEDKVGNHLYEPHHDIAECGYLTAIYYIDSDYKEGSWCGGELTLYKQLTFADYPENSINILPKQNRLIIFPGYTIHRVKPYFGNIPRTSLVFGWSVIDGKNTKPLIV